MRVLITGVRGLIGSRVALDLQAAGHTVVGYDLVDGRDVLDLPNLRAAAAGCDAVVHAAALFGNGSETDEEVLKVNLIGTENVLLAATDAGIQRIVHLSSVDVLGVFKGEGRPDYLPLDDAHPCRPRSVYGRSKHLSEASCRQASETSGLSVINLRPPGVWTDSTYQFIKSWSCPALVDSERLGTQATVLS